MLSRYEPGKCTCLATVAQTDTTKKPQANRNEMQFNSIT